MLAHGSAINGEPASRIALTLLGSQVRVGRIASRTLAPPFNLNVVGRFVTSSSPGLGQVMWGIPQSSLPFPGQSENCTDNYMCPLR